jgi:mannose-6-phosphate isomerase-like protein (cupin superfamily)
MIDGDLTAGNFSLVEHPMSARALAAPLHRHSREDEYSYVLEGRLGALLGEDVLEAGPGDLVFKPRDQWHTFWNAADEPCRILEIIAPAGFERFFEELVDMGGVTQAQPEVLAELCRRYALEMDPDSLPGLLERFGLTIGEPLPR